MTTPDLGSATPEPPASGGTPDLRCPVCEGELWVGGQSLTINCGSDVCNARWRPDGSVFNLSRLPEVAGGHRPERAPDTERPDRDCDCVTGPHENCPRKHYAEPRQHLDREALERTIRAVLSAPGYARPKVMGERLTDAVLALLGEPAHGQPETEGR